VAALHDSSAGQSVIELHPHDEPASHTWPVAETVQSLHAPDAPHASFAAPATHAPPDEQQPPLHPVVPAPHVAEHAWVVVLHACPEGQSAGALHPHTLLARHAWPAPLIVQSEHTVPLPPHCPGLVPDWHVPELAPEQHPVGQGCAAPQTKTQIPPEHPRAPGPQSLTVVQPHWPPWATGSHAWP
jgi:hypothetical protein